jgi:hypothetical protein
VPRAFSRWATAWVDAVAVWRGSGFYVGGSSGAILGAPVGFLWGLGRVSAVAYARGAVFGFFVCPAVSASRSWSQELRRLGGVWGLCGVWGLRCVRGVWVGVWVMVLGGLLVGVLVFFDF